MTFVVLFEDNPGLDADVRQQHMPTHLKFLEDHSEQITDAGPLTSESGEPAGGLWVVFAADFDAVDALVKSDPFLPTGLRKSVRILSWTQVFAGGQRLI